LGQLEKSCALDVFSTVRNLSGRTGLSLLRQKCLLLPFYLRAERELRVFGAPETRIQVRKVEVAAGARCDSEEWTSAWLPADASQAMSPRDWL
jgi:hypothetical protein